LRWGLTDIYINMQPYQSVIVPAIAEYLYFESEKGFEVLETSVPDLGGGVLEEMAEWGISKDEVIALGGADYSRILKEYLT